MSPADEVIRAHRRVETLTAQLGDAVQALAVASRRAAGYVRADLADVQAIIHEVAGDFGVLPAAILGQAKPAEIAEPRKIAMHLAHNLTPHSLHLLGRVFNRDHGTVHLGATRVVELMQTDAKLCARVERLRAQCERRLELMRPKEGRAM